MNKMLIDRAVVEQALEALELAKLNGKAGLYPAEVEEIAAAITALRAALAEPQEPWEHLKQYGYAPGSYMSRCHACDKIASGVDKRAITCRPCAEARHATLAAPVQEPVACRYPDCVDNGPEGKCVRWLVGECEGPKIGGQARPAHPTPRSDKPWPPAGR